MEGTQKHIDRRKCRNELLGHLQVITCSNLHRHSELFQQEIECYDSVLYPARNVVCDCSPPPKKDGRFRQQSFEMYFCPNLAICRAGSTIYLLASTDPADEIKKPPVASTAGLVAVLSWLVSTHTIHVAHYQRLQVPLLNSSIIDCQNLAC